MNKLELLKFQRDILLYVCEEGIDDMKEVGKKVDRLEKQIRKIKKEEK
jgi:polyhydroxyalkanoate synthesis regulator phasin